ncbi:MAG TPA: hypothetical protein VKI19_03990, partial [Acidimicrobiales bacterium]|nr:hypothetical protein [Acidimicrobiales bacterium]
MAAATILLGAGPALAATTAPTGTPPLFEHSLFSQPVVDTPVAGDSPSVVSDLVLQYKRAYGSVGVNRMPIF